jgi:hypothetical protein
MFVILQAMRARASEPEMSASEVCYLSLFSLFSSSPIAGVSYGSNSLTSLLL